MTCISSQLSALLTLCSPPSTTTSPQTTRVITMVVEAVEVVTWKPERAKLTFNRDQVVEVDQETLDADAEIMTMMSGRVSQRLTALSGGSRWPFSASPK